MSATTERRASLTTQITRVFIDSHETYGYRRVTAQLARDGIEAGPNWSGR